MKEVLQRFQLLRSGLNAGHLESGWLHSFCHGRSIPHLRPTIPCRQLAMLLGSNIEQLDLGPVDDLGCPSIRD